MAKAKDIPGLRADLPFAEAAALTVRARTQELLPGPEGVLGTQDIEPVHDMRVATRRLRAVLEIYAPCFPKDVYKPVLRDVKALADALGARRDPDVQLAALGTLLDALAPADAPGLGLLAQRLRSEQAAGGAVLAAALAEVERSDLRGRLLDLADRAAA